MPVAHDDAHRAAIEVLHLMERDGAATTGELLADLTGKRAHYIGYLVHLLGRYRTEQHL